MCTHWLTILSVNIFTSKCLVIRNLYTIVYRDFHLIIKTQFLSLEKLASTQEKGKEYVIKETVTPRNMMSCKTLL